MCVYDGANQLRGEYVVARAGDSCDGTPCWSAISDQGYRYKDRSLTTDGILGRDTLGDQGAVATWSGARFKATGKAKAAASKAPFSINPGHAFDLLLEPQP